MVRLTGLGCTYPMQKPVLVLGATGKTGRRIVDQLTARGLPVRTASRSGQPPFLWEDESTWAPLLENAASVYIAYYPDIGAPGAAATVGAFAERAVSLGVPRIVLLSGRGEEEAARSEQEVRKSGADWTILRASWFAQNFSEGFLLDLVLSGQVVLPAGAVVEPFVDVDDIADVAVAALTETGHSNKLYELTGPYALTFADAVAEIAAASGRDIRYQQVSVEDFAAMLAGVIDEPGYAEFLSYLFTDVLDGRNSQTVDGVQQALGRPATSFRDYARKAAPAWKIS
jgi:uncharacterized protein YbjT (DUF2867 family)